MKRLLFTLLSSLLLIPSVAHAADLDSVTPAVSIRDGTIPPQPGVELFVFAGSAPYIEYTVVFKNVAEEPASVVALPAAISSIAYDGGAQTLTVVMTHQPYVEGTIPPGPSTDFSIALIPAGVGGTPTALRGSWMATNISPSDWTLVPPTLSNPSFGYQIAGPVGEAGYLTMFIPDSLFAFIATISGQTMTAEDFAVFSGSTQTNISLTPQVGGGVLVKVRVPFTSTNPGLTEIADGAESETAHSVTAQAASVAKTITVGRQAALSIGVNPTGKVRKNKKAKLFGCVASRVPFTSGEKLSLVMTPRSGKATTVKVSLNAKGCYTRSQKLTKETSFQASLAKRLTIGRGTAVKSKKLTIKVR
jgi:hypothetical protein